MTDTQNSTTAPTSEPTPAPSASAPVTPVAAAVAPNGKKILIAEDEPFLVKVYEAKMSKTGYEIKVAKNGEEVSEILKSFTPNLILLDLIMPKKDGFEVLKELKASAKWKNIPVVVTSNLSQPEDKAKVKELGAMDYIVKSDVSILDIIERVQQYMA
jgi:DNA-binding response OmpR family regulator